MKKENKLKKFVSGVGEKITEKANAVAEKANYVLEVTQDKAGKAIGVVRDVAGKVVEVITDNVAAIARGVVMTGVIIILGLGTVACDIGGPSSGQEQNGPKDPGKEEPKVFSAKDIPFQPVALFDMQAPPDSGPRLVEAMDTNTRALVHQITNINHNIRFCRDIRRTGMPGYDSVVDIPDETFMERIELFSRRVFRNGHGGMHSMIDELMENHVAEDNRELFAAYIKALCGMGFIGVRQNDKADYSSVFQQPWLLNCYKALTL